MTDQDRPLDNTDHRHHRLDHHGHHHWQAAARQAWAPDVVHTPRHHLHLQRAHLHSDLPQLAITDNQPQAHVERKDDDINELVVRHGHKPDDASANFAIDKNGQVTQTRPPHHGLDAQDHKLIVEVEGDNLTPAQTQALKRLTGDLYHTYKHLEPATDLPADLNDVIKSVPKPEAEPPATPQPGPDLPTASQAGGLSHGSGGGGSDSGRPTGGGGRGGGGSGGDSTAGGGAPATGGGGANAVDLSNIGADLGNDPVGITARMIIQHESGGKPVVAIIDSNNVPAIGLFGANQKGELPALLASYAQDPQNYANLVKIFGPEIAARMKQGDLNFNMNGMLDQLKQLCGDPNFIKTQEQFLKKTIIDVGHMVGKPPYNVTSAEGVSILVDAYQQYGPGGFKQFLNQAIDQPTQEGKVAAIEAALKAGKYGQHYAKDIATIQQGGLNASSPFFA